MSGSRQDLPAASGAQPGADSAKNISCAIHPRWRRPARLAGSSLILALITSLSLGCGARETEEEFLVKNAVRKYNTALVESYRTGDPSLLDSLATEPEIHRVDILIATLQGQNRRLRASLERIDFGDVQVEGARLATVRTREVWSYEHVDATRQTRVGDLRRIEYDLLYSLERHGAKWLVASLAHSEERSSE